LHFIRLQILSDFGLDPEHTCVCMARELQLLIVWTLFESLV